MEVLMSWRKANLTLVLWRRAVDRTTVGYRYKWISPKDDSVVFGLNHLLRWWFAKMQNTKGEAGWEARVGLCLCFIFVKSEMASQISHSKWLASSGKEMHVWALLAVSPA